MAGGDDVLLCRLLGQVSWHFRKCFQKLLEYAQRSSLGAEPHKEHFRASLSETKGHPKKVINTLFDVIE